MMGMFPGGMRRPCGELLVVAVGSAGRSPLMALGDRFCAWCIPSILKTRSFFDSCSATPSRRVKFTGKKR